MKSVCHLTSVHPRFDVRIFLKQCQSLASAGYDVALVVADGKGEETKDGIRILDAGIAKGRLDRMLKATRRVYKKALEMGADIYHLHDPELIPFGLKLKKQGKKVILDAHEDVPAQILSKPYLNHSARRVVSWGFGIFERLACSRLDGIIAATPHIRDKFLSLNPSTIDVNNFPILGELESLKPGWSPKEKQVCYVGGIGAVRGIREMVWAMELTKSGARLQLGGKFDQADLEQEVKRYPGWQRVNQLGWLNRQGVRNILENSIAGLVTLQPIANYIDALPVKMFEYMSAGIPVIASNFPLWREIVEGNACGLCVDPLQPKEIAEAIDFIVNNPEKAEAMGSSGRAAVQEKYNWGVEEKKLIGFYEQVLGKNI